MNNYLTYTIERESDVCNLIFSYKNSVNSLKNKILSQIHNDSELAFYFSEVDTFKKNNYTILDAIEKDFTLQHRHSDTLKNYLRFYAVLAEEELQFLEEESPIENSINAFHSNNDKFFAKLRMLKGDFDSSFDILASSFDDNLYTFTIDDCRISIPRVERGNNAPYTSNIRCNFN